MRHPRPLKIAAFCIAAAAGLILISWSLMSIAARLSPGYSDQFAAWLQAVGSIVVIPIAVWVARWQTWAQDAAERGRRQQVDEDDRRRLACMLAAELMGLKQRVERTNLIASYSMLGQKLLSGDFEDLPQVFTARGNVTVIFDTAGVGVGVLGRDLANRLVTLYVEIKSFMETMNNFGDAYLREGSSETFLRMAPFFSGFALEIAQQCDELLTAGDEIIAELREIAEGNT